MMSSRVPAARLLLNLLLTVLSFAIPKNRRLVVFGCGGNLYKGNPRYVYEYACTRQNEHGTRQNSNFDPLWITDNRQVYRQLLQQDLPVVQKNSLSGFLAILRARLMVIDFTMRDISYAGTLPGRFTIMQTWHGIPLKRIALDQLNFQQKMFSSTVAKRFFFQLKRFASRHEYKRYRAIICGSETEQSILQQAFGNQRVYVTGFPRNDRLVGAVGIEQRKQLSLDSATKVVLYAPTFRDLESEQRPFSIAAAAALEHILDRHNACVLVKRHPHDTRTSLLTGRYVEDITESGSDIQDILPAVDILITDYSSVFFDFLLTDRPIILYPYDLEFYMDQCRGFYFPYAEITPGEIARDENQLLTLLEQQLSAACSIHTKGISEAYNCVKSRFHRFRDDQSCNRVYNLVSQLL